MRENLPITGQEFPVEPDATLMSTTDTASKIRYVNSAFVSISGFSERELLEQPHNIVRHPDMPVEAFADMWATLKSGRPWTGLVKNRRKNGDHYWVRANAAPVVRDGRTQGYISVRTTPERSEIEAAEELYQRFKSKQHEGLKLQEGVLITTGWRSILTAHRRISVRHRIRAMQLMALLCMVACLFFLTSSWEPWLLQSAVLAAVMLGLNWALERQVAQPAEDLLDQALKVASGERLTVQHMQRCDEFGMTLRSISQLGLMFRWLINDVASQAVGVEVASAEIAVGNGDLSSRTERAAASVQQTASAMT